MYDTSQRHRPKVYFRESKPEFVATKTDIDKTKTDLGYAEAYAYGVICSLVLWNAATVRSNYLEC